MAEYTFNKNRLNILKQCIIEKKLNHIIDINHTYKLDYILEIVYVISTSRPRNKYTLHGILSNYLNLSVWNILSINKIKTIIKTQIIVIDNCNLLNNYVIINYNFPITIKELVVVI